MPREKKQNLKQRPDGRYACKYKGQFFYGLTEREALAAGNVERKIPMEAIHYPARSPYFTTFPAILPQKGTP